jgi:murein DD-endopeptidase MepM/ murein hydrolase activator NlpD
MRRKSLPARPSLLPSVLMLAWVSGCGGGGSDGGDASGGFIGPPLTDVVNPEPGAGNAVIRLFSRPFAGQYQVLNYFDHDLPVNPNDTNGYQVNWRGARVIPGKDINGYDGHKGTDWLLPQNTPVFAVTGGEIVFAGGNTFPCPIQDNELLTNLQITLKFIAPDGEAYTVVYTHLNRIDVAVGDRVSEGQQLGLSGVTGCVGKSHVAHLHFELAHVTSSNPLLNPVIDPYGWEGPGIDPWSAQGAGRASVWFWKQGQAPDMVRQRP